MVAVVALVLVVVLVVVLVRAGGGRGHPGCGIPCSVAPIITLLARSMLPEYAPASYLMSRGPRAIVAEVMDSEDLSKGL